MTAPDKDASPQWHGWRRGDVSLHVGPVSYRRGVALYLTTSNVSHTPLAYFRSPRSAQRFMEWMDGGLDARTVLADDGLGDAS